MKQKSLALGGYKGLWEVTDAHLTEIGSCFSDHPASCSTLRLRSVLSLSTRRAQSTTFLSPSNQDETYELRSEESRGSSTLWSWPDFASSYSRVLSPPRSPHGASRVDASGAAVTLHLQGGGALLRPALL